MLAKVGNPHFEALGQQHWQLTPLEHGTWQLFGKKCENSKGISLIFPWRVDLASRNQAAPSNAGLAEIARRLRARRVPEKAFLWVPGQPYHTAAVKRLVPWIGGTMGWMVIDGEEIMWQWEKRIKPTVSKWKFNCKWISIHVRVEGCSHVWLRMYIEKCLISDTGDLKEPI